MTREALTFKSKGSTWEVSQAAADANEPGTGGALVGQCRMGAGTEEEEVKEASKAATWVARPWSETSVASNLAKARPRSLLPPRARRTAIRHNRSIRERTPSWQGEAVARTRASVGARLG